MLQSVAVCGGGGMATWMTVAVVDMRDGLARQAPMEDMHIIWPQSPARPVATLQHFLVPTVQHAGARNRWKALDCTQSLSAQCSMCQLAGIQLHP